MEDPALANGLVKRDVVRLMTPGTLTDESILSQREANFLAAVVQVPIARSKALNGKPWGSNTQSESDLRDPKSEMAYGLAWVEMSTGEFRAAARCCCRKELQASPPIRRSENWLRRSRS
jgi:DNA mismatch repair ATPase MutS